MGPFLYPKVRHRRSADPGPYSDYRRYKLPLKREFGSRCVYCRAPDVGQPHTFAVEHYRPKSDPRFEHLKSDWPNLFYACAQCNSFKGVYWPTPEQEAQFVFIPNPCDHAMFEHLRFVDLAVKAQSPAGKWAHTLLKLDSDARISHRRFVVAAAKQLTRELAEWDKTLNDLEKHAYLFPEESAQVHAEIELARTNREAVASDLADLGG